MILTNNGSKHKHTSQITSSGVNVSGNKKGNYNNYMHFQVCTEPYVQQGPVSVAKI